MTKQNQVSGPHAQYFQKLTEGEHCIQQCNSCSKHTFYPRVHCAHCNSQDLKWVQTSGNGTIYSTTTVRKKPEQGGDYNVCLVDLEEGVRLMSSVINVAPDDVKIGMAVKSTIVQEDEQGVLYFEAVEENNR